MLALSVATLAVAGTPTLRGAQTLTATHCPSLSPEACFTNKQCHWYQGHCGGEDNTETVNKGECLAKVHASCNEHCEMRHVRLHTHCVLGQKECSSNKDVQNKMAAKMAPSPFGSVARRSSTGLPFKHEHFCRYDCKAQTKCSLSQCEEICKNQHTLHYKAELKSGNGVITRQGGGCFGLVDFMNGGWPACSPPPAPAKKNAKKA